MVKVRGRYRAGRSKHQQGMIKKFDEGRIELLSESLGWALVDDLIGLVDSRPLDGLLVANSRIEKLANVCSTSPQVAQRLQCLEVALLSILATANRSLGKLDKAESILFEAASLTSCLNCDAEIMRNLCMLYCCQRKPASAESVILKASRFYERTRSEGHNRSGNALASCLFASSMVSVVRGDLPSAIDKLRSVIGMVSIKRSASLFVVSHAGLSTCLIMRGDDGDLTEADRYVDLAFQQARKVKGLSIPKAKISWIRGMIKGRLGEARAERILLYARDQLLKLNLTNEAIMVTSDIARLHMVREKDPTWLVEEAFVAISDLIPEGAINEYLEVCRCLRVRSPKKLYHALLSLRDFEISSGARSATAMPCLLPEIKFLD